MASFDLLVIDILMPEGRRIRSKTGIGDDTGIELIKKILELQITLNRFIPIAVLTQLDIDEINGAIRKIPESQGPLGLWRVWSKANGSAEFARELSIWFHKNMLDRGYEYIRDGWDLLTGEQRWELLTLFSKLKSTD